MNIFSFRYFKSLCLCDLSISCIRTAFLQSHRVFLFILGERTGSLLGIIFLYITDFYISIFSHPSYSCFPCSILSHTVFLLGAYSVVCASWLCIQCLYSVFFHPMRLEGSLFGGPYIFGGPYLFGCLYLFGGLLARQPFRLRTGSPWHFDTNCVINGAIDL